MDQEADRQKERHPRQVDNGDRPVAGEEGADLVEVADRLLRVRGACIAGTEGDQRPMHDLAEMVVDQGGGADDDARPDQFEQALETVGADEKYRQRDQRGNAAAGEHPIVNLEHVERPGQHQDVDHAGEQRNAPERPLAFGQRRRDSRMGLLLVLGR